MSVCVLLRYVSMSKILVVDILLQKATGQPLHTCLPSFIKLNIDLWVIIKKKRKTTKQTKKAKVKIVIKSANRRRLVFFFFAIFVSYTTCGVGCINFDSDVCNIQKLLRQTRHKDCKWKINTHMPIHTTHINTHILTVSIQNRCLNRFKLAVLLVCHSTRAISFHTLPLLRSVQRTGRNLDETSFLNNRLGQTTFSTAPPKVAK